MKKIIFLITGLTLGLIVNSQVVFINPASQEVDPSQTFTTTVEISQIQNLGAFELELVFDTELLQANSITLGGFLGSTGRTVFPLTNNIDNTIGLIEYAVTTLGSNPPGPNGDGVLLIIEWISTSIVSEDIITDLILQNILVLEPNSTTIPIDSQNGSVSILYSEALNTAIENQTTCSGTVIVPVLITNFEDIIAFNLTLNYTNTELLFTSFLNINPQINGLTVNDDGSSLLINYSGDAVTIANGTLLELEFLAISNPNDIPSILSWDETISSYNTSEGNPNTSYTNGIITIEAIPADANPVNGNTSICQGVYGEAYSINEIENANTYIWELNPPSAGAINGDGIYINIDYSNTFSGEAVLSVFGSNSCGNGAPSSLLINVIANPICDAGSDDGICSGEDYTLSASASNQDAILWVSSGDGTFDDESSLTATYTPGTDDISNESVILSLTAFAITPCDADANDNIVLSIDQSITEVTTPEGPTDIDINFTPTTTYSTYSQYTSNYEWMINPPSAGSISGNTMTEVVIWNSCFQGIAYIKVIANNGCNSLTSDSLEVLVDNSVGIEENTEYYHQTYIIITYPSPFKEEMTIQYRVGQAGVISFKVFDIYGKLLSETESINREIGDYEMAFKRENLSRGVYLISLVVDGVNMNSRRILVN